MTDGPESADAPRRSRRAAGSTADAGHQERESQQRARDREALRAYKALTDSQPRPEESGANPPTRRQLRIAQQQAQQAARAEAGRTQEGLDAASDPAQSKPAAQPAARSRGTESHKAAESNEVAGSGNAAASAQAPETIKHQSTPAGSGRRSGAALPDLPRSPKQAGSSNAPGGTAPRSEAAPQVPSRRERRRRAAEEQPAPVIQPVTPAPSRAPLVQAPEALAGPEAPAAPDSAGAAPRGTAAKPPAEAAARAGSGADANADIADMSVEQALAAREALKHQARNQVAAMEALQQADPKAVDLELLAQQRALAERAAVLNRRTQNIQRLAQENEQRRSPQSDPTTAHNLAMVTPLEFVEVPGVGRPVMKPPATSHVPVVTSSNPAAPKAAASGPASAAPGGRQATGTGRAANVRQQVKAAGPADRTGSARTGRGAGDVRHSKILARADALVNAPLEADQGAKPIGARSAFGLDPLDVMTAGLGRSRRIRAVSLGIVGVGLAALILGIIMIVGGLGS